MYLFQGTGAVAARVVGVCGSVTAGIRVKVNVF